MMTSFGGPFGLSIPTRLDRFIANEASGRFVLAKLSYSYLRDG
jgi:hypothetical protein